MTCREFWNTMPELEPETGQFPHAQECASCAALLERQRVLAASLHRAATGRHFVEAPSHLEAKVLDSFRARMAVHSVLRERRARVMRWIPAAAAVLLLASGLAWRWQQTPARTAGEQVARFQWYDAGDPETDFIPLTNTDDSPVVNEADIVQVRVPRSALVALGLPLEEEDASELVQAEVLLGAGGTPTAVRLVQ